MQPKPLDQEPWQLSSECTTRATEPDGTRHDCDSAQPSIIEAPDGWVYDHQHYEEHISKNGTNNWVFLKFENFIRPFPDVPQIEYPTKITLSVHARSPGGHSTGRGWTKATYKGRMFSYKQLIDNVKDSLNLDCR
ncbi:hypothetical protein ABE060_05465 [Bacillus rugosus]|uniref:hypothetical protein n=1 Tax=Bacillus rugosus TaxID=2715209 RepID=UPI001423CB82|nr:hypothetical protein [Bacillus rugosus]NUF07071.1 hypothetical protein [Bacillus rugosus]